MFEDDPQSWSGDTPTPSASTSGSSVSTLTVDETAFLSKCDVGEAFELTYWAAIREYWKEDPEDDYDSRSEQKHVEGEAEELPSDIFELVEISLDDDSDLKADSVLLSDGLAKLIGRWWETNVSMIIPDGHEIRDHFSLEKTYLAYFRTAMSLAMSSAMLSQFYIFSTPTTEPHPLDFRDVGKPLACACLGTAIIVNVIGAARFHRAQDALLNGKALVGGADLMLVGTLIGMLVLAFLVTAIIV